MAQSEANMQKILNAMQMMDRNQLMQLNRELIEILKNRRRREAFRMMQELDKGDAVKIRVGIKPKYLIGVTGTVTAIRSTKVEFRPDPQFIGNGRYLNGGPIIVPANCLELIP